MVDQKILTIVRISLRGFALVTKGTPVTPHLFLQLCAIVVMGTIADKLRTSRTIGGTTYTACAYGLTETSVSQQETSYGDEKACDYGIAVGVLGLVSAVALIALDVVTDLLHLGGGTLTKVATIMDVGVSAVMSLLWVVGFIYLTDTWKKSNSQSVDIAFSGSVDSAANASIAFSFFAAATWIALTVFAVLRLRKSGSSQAQASSE